MSDAGDEEPEEVKYPLYQGEVEMVNAAELGLMTADPERLGDLIPNGTGSVKYAEDGDLFEGTWVNGVRQGRGKYTFLNKYKDGSAYYEGDYVDNQKQGKGVFVYPDGGVYEGDFVAGLYEGYGTYTYPPSGPKDVYVGEWKAGKKEGKGRYLFASGALITGTWSDNAVTEGTLTSADGSYVYEGAFTLGQPSGEGFYVVHNGVSVSGDTGVTLPEEGSEDPAVFEWVPKKVFMTNVGSKKPDTAGIVPSELAFIPVEPTEDDE